jgi:hypothetical protein
VSLTAEERAHRLLHRLLKFFTFTGALELFGQEFEEAIEIGHADGRVERTQRRARSLRNTYLTAAFKMLKLCLSLLATPAAAQFIMGAFLYFLNVLFCCCWGLLRDCPRGSRPRPPHTTTTMHCS